VTFGPPAGWGRTPLLREACAAKITSIEAHAAQKPAPFTSLSQEISTQLRHRDHLRFLQQRHLDSISAGDPTGSGRSPFGRHPPQAFDVCLVAPGCGSYEKRFPISDPMGGYRSLARD